MVAVLIKIAGVTEAVTDIVTLLEVATAPVDVVTLQRITSPSESVLSVNTGLLLPVFIPFFIHWKAGLAPPFTVEAVKETSVPEHIPFADAETEMDGGRNVVTGSVTLLTLAADFTP